MHSPLQGAAQELERSLEGWQHSANEFISGSVSSVAHLISTYWWVVPVAVGLYGVLYYKERFFGDTS